MSAVLIDQIDAVLPQTQCGECSYHGCRPYAIAIVENGEAINRCPPGGVNTLKQLAALTQQSAEPYLDEIAQKTRTPSLAKIVEVDCIGCTKCIQACPVDAILGAAKQMHAVIESECTGCGLCVPSCPVDCIEMIPLAQSTFTPEIARTRFNNRNARLAAAEAEKVARQQARERAKKKAYVEQALARVNQKKQEKNGPA